MAHSCVRPMRPMRLFASNAWWRFHDKLEQNERDEGLCLAECYHRQTREDFHLVGLDACRLCLALAPGRGVLSFHSWSCRSRFLRCAVFWRDEGPTKARRERELKLLTSSCCVARFHKGAAVRLRISIPPLKTKEAFQKCRSLPSCLRKGFQRPSIVK